MPPREKSWRASARKYDLPSNWRSLRRAVEIRAAGRCEKMKPNGRCTEKGSECHHVGDRHDHSLGNLAWLCVECHLIETHKQAQAAARATQDKLSHPSSRSTRKPPGLL